MSTQTAVATFALEYVKTIGSVTVQPGRGFINPYDMVVSTDQRLFILNRCDSARAALVRVGVMNFAEDYLGEFGKGYGAGDGQFTLPVAMALDSQERLYITDEHLHRVSIFDVSGNFLGKCTCGAVFRDIDPGEAELLLLDHVNEATDNGTNTERHDHGQESTV